MLFHYENKNDESAKNMTFLEDTRVEIVDLVEMTKI